MKLTLNEIMTPAEIFEEAAIACLRDFGTSITQDKTRILTSNLKMIYAKQN
jgi:hypothetical protein